MTSFSYAKVTLHTQCLNNDLLCLPTSLRMRKEQGLDTSFTDTLYILTESEFPKSLKKKSIWNVHLSNQYITIHCECLTLKLPMN